MSVLAAAFCTLALPAFGGAVELRQMPGAPVHLVAAAARRGPAPGGIVLTVTLRSASDAPLDAYLVTFIGVDLLGRATGGTCDGFDGAGLTPGAAAARHWTARAPRLDPLATGGRTVAFLSMARFADGTVWTARGGRAAPLQLAEGGPPAAAPG